MMRKRNNLFDNQLHGPTVNIIGRLHIKLFLTFQSGQPYTNSVNFNSARTTRMRISTQAVETSAQYPCMKGAWRGARLHDDAASTTLH